MIWEKTANSWSFSSLLRVSMWLLHIVIIDSAVPNEGCSLQVCHCHCSWIIQAAKISNEDNSQKELHLRHCDYSMNICNLNFFGPSHFLYRKEKQIAAHQKLSQTGNLMDQQLWLAKSCFPFRRRKWGGTIKKNTLDMKPDSTGHEAWFQYVWKCDLALFCWIQRKNLDPFLGRNFALFAEERVIYKSQRNVCHATFLDLDPIIFELIDLELRTKTKN